MRNVLITGVNGGMGYNVAKYLYENGYNVYGIDLKADCPLPIHYYSADLCNPTQIQEVFNSIKGEVSCLYAILHFAGFYTMNSLVEISEEEFIKIFNVNLFSVYRINKIFLPLIEKGGRIIVTSSELAPLDPLPFTGLYAITKSSIEKYADSLRMELNLLGIKVSVIRPGAVNTNMIGASLSSMDKLCNNTVLYKENTSKFKKIVDSVETKKISPLFIAKLSNKILKAKNPKFTYNINRNFLLRLLSVLPKKTQVKIITGILKK